MKIIFTRELRMKQIHEIALEFALVKLQSYKSVDTR